MDLSVNTNTILLICSVIISVSGACGVIVKLLKKWTSKLTDNVKDEVKEEIKMEVVDPLKEDFTGKYHKAVEDFSIKLDYIMDCLKEQKDYRDRREKEDVSFRLATLKGLIISAHGTYTQLGKIDTHVLSTLEDIYDEYKELGGNHFVENLMEDIKNLEQI